MRSTLKILVILIVSFALATGMAKAIDPVTGTILASFVLQSVNDARQDPVDKYIVGLNPLYHTYYDGMFGGGCADPKTMISAVCRGAILQWEPGDISRTTILAFELIPNDPRLPARIGMYHELLANAKEVSVLSKPRKKGDKPPTYKDKGVMTVKVSDFGIKTEEVTRESPLYAKWRLPLETGCLGQDIISVRVRVWFVEEKAKGFLRLGRENVLQKEETLCKFVVIDPSYMQMVVNGGPKSLEIQSYLRANFGLMGGPPVIGSMQLEVSPKLTEGIPPGMPTTMSGQPGAPTQPGNPPSTTLPKDGERVRPNYDGAAGESKGTPRETRETKPARVVTVDMVMWKGSDRMRYRDITLDLNQFQEGTKIVYKRNAETVCWVEVGCYKEATDKEPATIEMYVYRGQWPEAGDTLWKDGAK